MGWSSPHMAHPHARGGYVTDLQARIRHGHGPRYRAKTSVIVGLVTALSLVAPSVVNAQSVTASCASAAGISDTCDRWYTGPSVAVTWSWQPASPTFSGCQNQAFAEEMKPVNRSCTVTWGGTTITKTVWIGIDRTPPQVVSFQTDRPPDYNGWFNHPVGLTFQGSDATSGVVSCSSTTYGGPDGQGAMVSGSCSDAAGHTGVGSLPINYDATPPPAPVVDSLPGNKRVALEWSTSPDTQAEVTRMGGGAPPVVVYQGPGGAFTDRSLKNGRRYRYAVSLIDQAGNRAVGTTSTVPTSSKLLVPPDGARIPAVLPPVLIWKPARRASYYNVQIFRGRTKVLSTWPKRPRLMLKRRWQFGGKRYRLLPGKYCWYVWPGKGRRAKRDYGKRLGRSCFRIVR
jgi:hypothetical protein